MAVLVRTDLIGKYLFADTLGAQIFGFWMIMKRYWNDPTERLEEHCKFLQGTFMAYYNENGWEHMLEGFFLFLVLNLTSSLRTNGDPYETSRRNIWLP